MYQFVYRVPAFVQAIALVLVVLTVLSMTAVFHVVNIAYAASITSASDTMSSQRINATSTHTIRFTTPTGASDNTDTIQITFPSDFNFTGKATSSLTFTHGPTTGLETTETLAGSPTGSAWGVATSGTQSRVWTLTAPTDGVGAGTVSPNDKIVLTFNSDNAINPSVATTYVISIAGAFGDSGDISVSILSDDQVSIAATVAQSITFSISDNTASFGTLTSGAAKYASGTASGDTSEVEAHNIIVGTNAANGYTLTASGTTLTSGSNTITPIGSSNTASSPGTEQFGLRMTSSGGSGGVYAPYDGAGFAFDTASFPDVIASSTVSSANTTYSARYLANITSNTEAGSYTSVITYAATANY